MLLVRGFQTLP